ncbi:hypothetical protein [Pseudomonas viridiflava]|uniref:hypothetical protein n=1 Tax=Pseudomonas viridiflava TaxID=33069 RepID=UPI001E2C0424|nr:hypothetical protein [Pseudomonas viridiflava]
MEKGNGLKQMEEQGFNGMGNKGKCLTRKGRRVRRKWAATKGHRRQPSKIVHTWKTYVALQETASPFKSYVGEVQHLLTSEQNYPRKAPSLGMMRDIFVIHDESMLPVKRPQDAGKGLPGAMFFLQHMPHAGPPVREDFMPTDQAPPIAHAAHDIIALNHPLLTPFFHQ